MVRQSAEEWRKLIVEAYIDLLYEKPYSKIKVSDICAVSKVPRSTFYTIFASADDCLEGIEKTLLSILSLKNQPVQQPDNSLGLSIQAISQWFETAFEHERALTAITGVNGDPYFGRRLHNQLEDEMFAFSNEDMVPQDDLLPYAIENLVGSYITLLTFSLHLPSGVKRISCDDLASICTLARVGYHVMVNGASSVSDKRLMGEFPLFRSSVPEQETGE